MLVRVFSGEFFAKRSSATVEKYELKAFAMLKGLLLKELLMFIVVTLLAVSLLLVIVLTMSQVVLDLLVELESSIAEATDSRILLL